MQQISALLAIFLFLNFSPAHAQEPFSTIHVGLNGDIVAAGNSILDHWNQTPGITLEARTPYFAGEFEAGTRFLRYNEDSFEGSGFRSIYVYLGWFYSFSINERLAILPGIRIGNHFMWQDNIKEYFNEFGDPNPFTFHRNESEFAYEPVLRVEAAITERITLYGSASYNRTLIHIPFSVTYVSFGIYRTFNTPAFLKRIMR